MVFPSQPQVRRISRIDNLSPGVPNPARSKLPPVEDCQRPPNGDVIAGMIRITEFSDQDPPGMHHLITIDAIRNRVESRVDILIRYFNF
jgi:hypothetical protein